MSIKNFLKDLIPPISKGLLAFGVFGIALYAYGAINFPDSDPNPASGVLGIYVGSSSVSTGNRSDYAGANALCANVPTSGANSHVCTVAEIVNSYNYSVSMPNTGFAWANNGPTFSGSNIANDCMGWSSASSSDLGAVWFFSGDNGYSGITPCNQTYAFACCK